MFPTVLSMLLGKAFPADARCGGSLRSVQALIGVALHSYDHQSYSTDCRDEIMISGSVRKTVYVNINNFIYHLIQIVSRGCNFLEDKTITSPVRCKTAENAWAYLLSPNLYHQSSSRSGCTR